MLVPPRTPEEALQAVVALHNNSRSALAEKLSLTPQAVCQWKIIPAGRVLKVEALVGGRVTRHQMRPDVFGPDPNVKPRRRRTQEGARV